ncbi:MAG: hypothetical protein H8D38_04165 [DPANN group archaeon]|nr:hypothetical protein [DPANN group archaeon]
MKLEKLVRKLEEVKRDPNSFQTPEEFKQLADGFYSSGRRDITIETLEIAVDRDITNDMTYYSLGFMHNETGDHEKIIEALEKAVEVNQTNELIFRMLSDTYVKTNKPEKAKIIWEKAAEKEQADINMIFELALSYQQEGNLEKAIAVSEQAVKSGKVDISKVVKKEDLNVLTNLSTFYLQTGQLEKAGQLCENILQKAATPAIVINLSTVYQYTGNENRAISLLSKALKKGFKVAPIYSLLGSLLMTKGNKKGAVSLWEEAVAIGETDSHILFNLPLFYLMIRNYERAKELSEMAIRKNQVQTGVFTNLAQAYNMLENTDKAIQVAEGAMKSGYIEPLLIHNLAGYYSLKDDEISSIQILEEGIRIGQVSPSIYSALYYYYGKSGYMTKALSVLDDAIEKGQSNDWIFSVLTTYYKNKSNLEKAREYAQKAIDINQTNSDIYYLVGSLEMEVDWIRELVNITEKNKTNILAPKQGDIEYMSETREGHFIHHQSGPDIVDEKDYRAYYYLSLVAGKHPLTKDKTPEDYFREMVSLMVQNMDFRVMTGTYKKATNQIKVISADSDLESTVVIKGYDTLNVSEIQNRDILEDIVGDIVDLPKHVISFEEEDMFFYVMRREGGHTLTDFMKHRPDRWESKKTSVNERLLLAMSRIYVEFPVKDLEDYDYRGKIFEKGYIEKILPHANPVIEAFEHSEYIGYFSDSWTDNWLINEDKVILIDTEDRGKTPFALDLAHYLNCIPHGTFEERIAYVKKAIEYVNETAQEKEIDRTIDYEDKFMNEYYNGVIYRALLNTASRRREKRIGDSRKIAKTGIEMIDFMEEQKLIPEEHINDYHVLKEVLEVSMK